MFKSIIALLFFTFLMSSGFAQVPDYDISKYKVPDYKYQSLSTYFDMGGGNKRYVKKLSSSNSINIFNNFKFGLDAGYFFNKNTRKSQSKYEVLFSTTPAFSNSFRIGGKKTTVFGVNNMLRISGLKRFYYHPNRYIGISGVNNVVGKNKRIKKEDQETINGSKINNYFSVKAEHGHGRVENVSNAWKALRFYKEFEKYSLLNGIDVSEEDISELADVLVDLSYRRFFDGRLRRIKELTTLSDFFKSKGMEESIGMFTTINDMFLYGVNRSRLSGSRLSYGVFFDNDFERERENDDKSTTNTNGGGLFVKYEKFRPINDKWQLNYGAEIDFGTDDLEVDEYFLRPDIYLNIGYYPTTRTTITSGFRYYFDNIIEEDVKKQNNSRLSWVTNANYYLSPRVRLSGEISIRAYNLKKESSFDLIYKLGVNYFFF